MQTKITKTRGEKKEEQQGSIFADIPGTRTVCDNLNAFAFSSANEALKEGALLRLYHRSLREDNLLRIRLMLGKNGSLFRGLSRRGMSEELKRRWGRKKRGGGGDEGGMKEDRRVREKKLITSSASPPRNDMGLENRERPAAFFIEGDAGLMPFCRI